MQRRDFFKMLVAVAAVPALPTNYLISVLRNEAPPAPFDFSCVRPGHCRTNGLQLCWGATDVDGYADYPVAFERQPFTVQACDPDREKLPIVVSFTPTRLYINRQALYFAVGI